MLWLLALAMLAGALLPLDHYALAGFPLHPVTVQRVVCLMLVIGGVALVRG